MKAKLCSYKLLSKLVDVTFVLVMLSIISYSAINMLPWTPSRVFVPASGAKIYGQPKKGEPVFIEIKYCNYWKSPTIVKYNLISTDNSSPKPLVRLEIPTEVVSSFDSRNLGLFGPCDNFIDWTYDLPRVMKSGTYKISITVTNSIFNGMREMDQNFNTESFYIK